MIDGVAVSGRVDRVDLDGRRAIVRDYKGRTVYPGARWAEDGRIQAALYALAVREQFGVEIVGALYQPIGTADQRPRGVVRDDVPGRYVNGDVSDDATLDERLEDVARDRRPGRRRPARRPDHALPRPLRLQRRLRPPGDLPRRMSRRFTPEQRAAIEARTGSSLLAANAGSGKTAVMVERIAAAVREDGVPVGAILALTFTEKAAGELAERLRRRLTELGERRARPRRRRRLDRHDPRLLRPPAALPAARRGPGPALRGARGRPPPSGSPDAAYERALEAWARADGAAAIDLAASYGPALRELSSTPTRPCAPAATSRPRLMIPPPPRAGPAPLAARSGAARPARRSGARVTAGATRWSGAACRVTAARAPRLRRRCGEAAAAAASACPWPGELDAAELKGGAKALTSEPCEAYRGRLGAPTGPPARTTTPARALTLLDALLDRFGAAYDAAKAERAAVDFEDLELRAPRPARRPRDPRSAGRSGSR